MARSHIMMLSLLGLVVMGCMSSLRSPTFVPPPAADSMQLQVGAASAPIAALSVAGPAHAADSASIPAGLPVFSIAFLGALAFALLQPKMASAYYGRAGGERSAPEKIAIGRRRDLIAAFAVMMFGDGLRWQGLPPWGMRMRGINAEPSAGRGYKTREADFRREREAERWESQERETREEMMTKLKDTEEMVVGKRLSGPERLSILDQLRAPIGGGGGE